MMTAIAKSGVEEWAQECTEAPLGETPIWPEHLPLIRARWARADLDLPLAQLPKRADQDQDAGHLALDDLQVLVCVFAQERGGHLLQPEAPMEVGVVDVIADDGMQILQSTGQRQERVRQRGV